MCGDMPLQSKKSSDRLISQVTPDRARSFNPEPIQLNNSNYAPNLNSGPCMLCGGRKNECRHKNFPSFPISSRTPRKARDRVCAMPSAHLISMPISRRHDVQGRQREEKLFVRFVRYAVTVVWWCSDVARESITALVVSSH